MKQFEPFLDPAFVDAEIERCGSKLKLLMERFKTTFPGANTDGELYLTETDNVEWTTSFYSGMMWLMYQHTHDNVYLEAIAKQLPSFHERVEKPGYIDTHDLGFLYSLTCMPAWQQLKSEHCLQTALKAADYLGNRYFPEAGIIQAWGDLSDPENRGRMIIDCLLNLPILYQASRITGDPRYAEMALNHAKQAQKFLVRPDRSTFHTYYMDVNTGAPRYGSTAQGYSDNSCWARGQAWSVLGFALSYSFTGDETFLETACQSLDYWMEHLPEDKVCYWDLIFTEGDQPRDTSAAAIVCCGILELLRHLPLTDSRRQDYQKLLLETMESLSRCYTTWENPKQEGFLLHGVYSIPHNRGVDEAMIWGDYFYLEALYRLRHGQCDYWI